MKNKKKGFWIILSIVILINLIVFGFNILEIF